MKAICFSQVERVDVLDLPNPEILDDRDAILRVTTAGLCGSDLHPYFGRETGIDPGTVMGHEFVGEVVSLGDAVKTHQLGDQVCSPFTTNCGQCKPCQMGLTARCTNGQLFGWKEQGVGLHGGQATHVRVPHADATLMKVPDGLPEETAILLGDNLSTAFYATELSNLKPDHSVAIIGCGTVGLLAIQWAAALGAKNIVALEPNGFRREMAHQLGATTASDPAQLQQIIGEITEGLGTDAVMEFVGLPEAQRIAYQTLRPGGNLATIGCHCTPNFAFSPSEAYDKNLTYRTGRCSARHYMQEAYRLSKQYQLDLSWCVTHRFQIDQAHLAYDVFANRKDQCVKAVFKI